MIRDLVRLANHLDDRGLHKEANYLDGIISKYAAVDQKALQDALDKFFHLHNKAQEGKSKLQQKETNTNKNNQEDKSSASDTKAIIDQVSKEKSLTPEQKKMFEDYINKLPFLNRKITPMKLEQF